MSLIYIELKLLNWESSAKKYFYSLIFCSLSLSYQTPLVLASAHIGIHLFHAFIIIFNLNS